MLSRLVISGIAVFLLVSVNIPTMLGQATSAVVKGTVSDASGGVVQGAKSS